MTTILVIEDMESLREEIIATLGYEGFDVIGAENGVVGVQLAKAHLPSLIICDVMMPELDGYGTLTALRQNVDTATIPFIFLTAKADKLHMRQGMELGADDYLTKPFTTSELLGAITARLKKYAAVQAHYDTEIKRAESRLEYIAHHDELTNLPNRALFHEHLQESLQHARANGQLVVLMFLDIDQFNIINNSLGHNIGDLLVKAIAERLRRFAPPCDAVARLRGDEFALTILGINSLKEARELAQKVLDLVSKPYSLYGHEVFITASMGITVYPNDHIEAEGLIKNADIALYYAKEQGRNLFKFYNAQLDERSSEHMALENSLRRARDRGEFRLFYQPQVDLRTGKIVGAEALIRWQHPEIGIVPPSKFIPVAESTGLILSLGEWVIKTACNHSMAWQMANLRPIRVAVNLSGQHFKHDNFVELVSGILQDTKMVRSNLEIELTESIIMQNADATVKMLIQLRDMGLKIAIDDFGTGYSSLSYLKHFPVDTLKIDHSFVQDVTNDRHDATITTAIIDLAHSLSLDVVAEGVETQEQLDFLQRHNCDRIQGYFFSRPVPVEQFERMLMEDVSL